MTNPFEGRDPADQRNLGYLLDNLDDYSGSPEILLTVLRESSPAVVTNLFSDPVAGVLVTSFIAALPGGATAVDSDTVIQYAQQLLVLVDDVDKANAGVEEEDPTARVDVIRARLQETQGELTALLTDAQNLLDLVPADTAGTGLAAYLLGALQVGGCNNVFAADARSVLEPLARYGYQTMSEQIRSYLWDDFQIDV